MKDFFPKKHKTGEMIYVNQRMQEKRCKNRYSIYFNFFEKYDTIPNGLFDHH